MTNTFGTKEGQRSVYRIAKQMAGERKDIVDMKCLKNESGEVLVEADAVKERWREYMERLLNIENDWDGVQVLAKKLEYFGKLL